MENMEIYIPKSYPNFFKEINQNQMNHLQKIITKLFPCLLESHATLHPEKNSHFIQLSLSVVM